MKTRKLWITFFLWAGKLFLYIFYENKVEWLVLKKLGLKKTQNEKNQTFGNLIAKSEQIEDDQL